MRVAYYYVTSMLYDNIRPLRHPLLYSNANC
jgi:hypothetical protein